MSRLVTIDGPSASGKSTVARKLARLFGFLYVDSGSLYRGISWEALESDVDMRDAERIGEFASRVSMEFFVVDGAVRFKANGSELVEELRTVRVDRVVSIVAAVPGVRTRVVGWLREMAGLGDLVVEGRDIGTAVFPEAKYKFYLDASAEQRASRRHAEMVDRRDGTSMGETKAMLEARDAIDQKRQTDPLRVPDGAMVIDSTSMSVEEVVGAIAATLPGNWSRS